MSSGPPGGLALAAGLACRRENASSTLRPLTCSAPSGVVLRRLLSSGNIPSSRTHGGPGWEDGLSRIQRRLEGKTHHTGPLQYSHLENPMDRGAWRTTVHRVAQSQTRQKQLSMQHAQFRVKHFPLAGEKRDKNTRKNFWLF